MPGSGFLGLSGALLALWSSGLTGPKKVTYTGCGDEVAYKTLTSRCSSFRPFVHPSERILQGSAFGGLWKPSSLKQEGDVVNPIVVSMIFCIIPILPQYIPDITQI